MKIKQNMSELGNMFMGISIGILVSIAFSKHHFEDWAWMLVIGCAIVSVVLGFIHQRWQCLKSSNENHSA